MANNYSEIVKNNYQILDLFKQLKDRENRIIAGTNENRLKFYRNFTQNQVELNHKRSTNEIEQDYENKLLKSGVFGQDEKEKDRKACISRPGYGKYDLDTGLNQAKKAMVRNSKENKNYDEFQKYMFRKEDMANNNNVDQKTAGFLEKMKGHGNEVKNREMECAHMENNQLSQQQQEDIQFKQQQLEVNEREFAQIYEEQKQRNDRIEDHNQRNHQHPLITELFSKNTNLLTDITHVKYMSCIENDEVLEQIVTQFRNMYPKQIADFGNDRFKNVIKSNQDRRILFKFINGEINFDQFTTRVICDTQNVKYYCKEDLLEQGISPHFFENLGSIKKYLLAAHGAKSIEEIESDQITFQCGQNKTVSEYMIDPKFKGKTAEAINKMIMDDKQTKQWKCNKKCLKSNFTIISRPILNKVNQKIQDDKTQANRQRFCKTTTFRMEIPINPNDKQKIEQKENEKLLNDQSKYVKKLLKQNFDKFRIDSKSQNNVRPESHFSNLSQVASSQKFEIKSGSKLNASVAVPAGQKLTKNSKLSDKLKTRPDLLFLRQLKEQGQNITYDPEIDMNLLYDWEREALFNARKAKVEVVKKKGPRHIIYPEMSTMNLKADLDAHGFSRKQFRQQLESAMSKSFGSNFLKEMKQKQKQDQAKKQDMIEILDVELQQQLQKDDQEEYLNSPLPNPGTPVGSSYFEAQNKQYEVDFKNYQESYGPIKSSSPKIRGVKDIDIVQQIKILASEEGGGISIIIDGARSGNQQMRNAGSPELLMKQQKSAGSKQNTSNSQIGAVSQTRSEQLNQKYNKKQRVKSAVAFGRKNRSELTIDPGYNEHGAVTITESIEQRQLKDPRKSHQGVALIPQQFSMTVTRNQRGISAISPSRGLNDKNRFILSSVEENRSNCNNSQVLRASVTNMAKIRARQNKTAGGTVENYSATTKGVDKFTLSSNEKVASSKTRPKSTTGGGFRISQQKVSRNFKMLTSQKYNKKGLPKSPANIDIDTVDHSQYKNMLSPTNTHDQKFLQYIQSIGIPINIPQSQTAQATLTESDFKQYVEFQKQCQRLYEEIHGTQSTIISRDAALTRSYEPHLKSFDKATGQLAIVEVGNLMAHPFSLGSPLANGSMIPISSSNATIMNNTRYLDRNASQQRSHEMVGANTQKTLTQNKRSLEGSPLINGAIYLNQDQSSHDIKDDEVIIDNDQSEVPAFVKELKTKYGTSNQAIIRPFFIKGEQVNMSQQIKKVFTKKYQLKQPKENEEILRRVMQKDSYVSTPKNHPQAIMETTNEFDDSTIQQLYDGNESPIKNPIKANNKKMKAIYPEANQKVTNFERLERVSTDMLKGNQKAVQAISFRSSLENSQNNDISKSNTILMPEAIESLSPLHAHQVKSSKFSARKRNDNSDLKFK